jgi:hypothetical protein
VKCELATFFAAFPHATVWANNVDGQGCDMVFMGHLDQAKIDVDAAEDRLRSPEYATVVESLREIGTPTAMDLSATYTGYAGDLGKWVEGAELNTDRDLRLQYLGGWGINSNLADPIYRDMLKHRRLADHPFTGSQGRCRGCWRISRAFADVHSVVAVQIPSCRLAPAVAQFCFCGAGNPARSRLTNPRRISKNGDFESTFTRFLRDVGSKLTSVKGPVETLVIESAEKASAN